VEFRASPVPLPRGIHLKEAAMKVGFVGLGRMGQAMTRRLLDGGHEVGVYNRTADKLKPVIDLGAKPMASIKAAANFGAAVFTMLADDAALFDVVEQPGGLKEALPPGGIHICAGTHSVAAINRLTAMHADAGQFLITMPVLGRPEVTLAGQSAVLVAGSPDKVEHCRALIAAIGGRVALVGAQPIAATVMKIANNFMLGCAIEAMGEGFALVRKYGVAPEVFYDAVLAEGQFACRAYKIYGQLIAEERYLPAGQRAVLAVKDVNLALAAGEAVGVPLPSGNIWRDRLVGAVAHGEGEHDWSVMARDQARASGLM
jgi:3-hydroxyisobutyrate dehydrogenase-like beta-hydroxyacid dehydrogenase